MWLLMMFTGAYSDPAIVTAAQGRADRQEFYHSLAPYPQACGWGEVIAKDVADPMEAVVLWLNSPSHSAVITQRWDRFGVGINNGFVVAAFENDC